jgi:dihydroflavonol-4-reductase
MNDNRGISLVTGATGHVGSNLVKFLLEKSEHVRAGVRNPKKAEAVLGPLGVPIVRAELMDRASLVEAMAGVDVVYAVAAAFKRWAKDPEREIVRVNIEGARNLIEAAAAARVRKVVYVSSMTALDSSVQPFSATTWNPLKANPYEYSKTEAEKLVLRLAGEKGLDVTTILPAAIIGPGYPEPTGSTGLFTAILHDQLANDPDLHLVLIDVRDVVMACHAAATKGRRGERYVISNETTLATGRMVAIAREMYPELKLRPPRKTPRWILRIVARVSEFVGRVFGRPPLIEMEVLRVYGGATHLRVDVEKTKRELGITPISNEESIRDSLRYVMAREMTGRPLAVQDGVPA